ncbi:hypothetical protein ACFXJ8_24015 [Nonomuraea sp. NPDC059194]|uniref:hypothetical protein n=1 Tax=Nonomuraea sp. NPDC059194 TaxID=3346764 RepID=UPI0036A106F8
MADRSGHDDMRGAGEAAAGLVSAEVGHDGLLEALHLNPRVLRLGSHDLAEQIVLAVRAAQRDLLDQIGDGGEEPIAPEGVDPEALMGRLDELELRAEHDFERLTSSLDETLRRLEGRVEGR